MAELQDSGSDKRRPGEKPKPKKMSTRIDMTPMVDLGFLLLTFFILTTTFGKPQVMELNMPLPKNDAQESTKFSKPMTILLDKGKMYYYIGVFEPDALPELTKISIDDGSLRTEVLEKNKTVYQKVRALQKEFQKANYTGSELDAKREELRVNTNEIKKDKNNNGLLVIIKPTSEAEYKDVVILLDEMNICNVVNYALVDITPEEEAYLKTQ